MQTRASPRCIDNAEGAQGLRRAAMAPREVPHFLDHRFGGQIHAGVHGWSAAYPEVVEIRSSSSALPMHEPVTDWSPLAAPVSEALPPAPRGSAPLCRQLGFGPLDVL